jgi:hypothetical protein
MNIIGKRNNNKDASRFCRVAKPAYIYFQAHFLSLLNECVRSSLLRLPAGLQVRSFDLVDSLLSIHVASIASESACPCCQCQTSRIHSQYTRKVADLACGGQQVQLVLHVRKFFCTNSECARTNTVRDIHRPILDQQKRRVA